MGIVLNSEQPCLLLIHADRLVSYVTFLSVAFVIEYIPVWLAKTNHTTTIILAWEKNALVFLNVYTGKEWNKAIHNGLTLPLVLMWYCHVSENSKMAAEAYTANDVLNLKFKMVPRLSKKCFVGFHMAQNEGLSYLIGANFTNPKTGRCAWTNQSTSQGPLGIKLSLTSTKRIETWLAVQIPTWGRMQKRWKMLLRPQAILNCVTIKEKQLKHICRGGMFLCLLQP